MLLPSGDLKSFKGVLKEKFMFASNNFHFTDPVILLQCHRTDTKITPSARIKGSGEFARDK